MIVLLSTHTTHNFTDRRLSRFVPTFIPSILTVLIVLVWLSPLNIAWKESQSYERLICYIITIWVMGAFLGEVKKEKQAIVATNYRAVRTTSLFEICWCSTIIKIMIIGLWQTENTNLHFISAFIVGFNLIWHIFQLLVILNSDLFKVLSVSRRTLWSSSINSHDNASVLSRESPSQLNLVNANFSLTNSRNLFLETCVFWRALTQNESLRISWVFPYDIQTLFWCPDSWMLTLSSLSSELSHSSVESRSLRIEKFSCHDPSI